MKFESDEYKEALEKASSKDIKKIVFVISCCIFCLLVIFASWNGFLRPETDKPYLWFQRSGSIVVFLSLYLDFNISKEKTRMSNQFPNSHEGDFFENFEKHLPIFQVLHIICLTIAVVGTVIWGYGDLLFKYFT